MHLAENATAKRCFTRRKDRRIEQEQEKSSNTFCVFCAVGQDNRVVQSLQQLGYPSLSFQQCKRYYHGEQKTTRKVPMLSRYVFFDADAQTEPDWYRIRSIPSVLKVLEYSDGERAFRKDDLAFVRWMKSMSGLLEVSQVLQVGTKIRVIGGALKHYEGCIVEVKKHRGAVAIQIGEDTHFSKIWCPVEYIEQA